MMPPTDTHRELADTEEARCLSVARPVIFGTITFLVLELLIAALLYTQTGQMLLPGRDVHGTLTSAMQSLVHLGRKTPPLR
jgi:hypothetical protein